MVAPAAAGAQVDAGRSRALVEWLEKTDDADAVPTLYVKLRGVEAMWRPGRAVLQCEAEQAEAMLAAVVEFSHYERELRRIEDEIANGWGELEQDKGLAFDVTPKDLRRSEAVGGRMARVIEQRMRYARIEPHLYEPGVRLIAAAQKLGDELRERARIESRLETVDAQIEVYEGVYEMASQRMGEYRAAREEHVLEWVIIVLLGAEAVLMAVQAVWRH
jgi:tetrahydromethanopterin S-methyltransferase subunit G